MGTYVNVYVCMSVRVCVNINICECVRMYIYVHVSACVCNNDIIGEDYSLTF